jgi:DNA-directed RNA polymerase specialized sigma24 family protein
MNEHGANQRGSRDTKEIADLARKSTNGSSAALHSLRLAIKVVERDVARRFGKLTSFNRQDAADNAFIKAVQTYNPDRGSFTSHFRRTFYCECIDRVRRRDKRPDILSTEAQAADGDTFTDILEDRGTPELFVADSFIDIKYFIVVAVAYLHPAELKSLQAAIRGESMSEAATRFRVSAQALRRPFQNVVRLARIFERGEVPWPATTEAVAEVRKKINVEP